MSKAFHFNAGGSSDEGSALLSISTVRRACDVRVLQEIQTIEGVFVAPSFEPLTSVVESFFDGST